MLYKALRGANSHMILKTLISLILFTSTVYAADSFPTSFRYFTSEMQHENYIHLFRYFMNDGKRELQRFDCYNNGKTAFKSNIEVQDTAIVQSWGESTPVENCLEFYSEKFSHDGKLSDYDERDHQLIDNLNKAFYPKIERLGTVTFQHGQRTKKVYVFLPGLYLSSDYYLNYGIKEFYNGNNVIVATLPGHERWNLPNDENALAYWVAYADYIGRIARFYGEKVIYVGHSTGGNLAIHAAESGQADELILYQPLIGLSKKVKSALKVTDYLPKSTFDFDISKYSVDPFNNLAEIISTGKEARLALSLPFKKLKNDIPVKMYLDWDDFTVDSSAAVEWSKQYAPHTLIQFHSLGHMYKPM